MQYFLVSSKNRDQTLKPCTLVALAIYPTPYPLHHSFLIPMCSTPLTTPVPFAAITPLIHLIPLIHFIPLVHPIHLYSSYSLSLTFLILYVPHTLHPLYLKSLTLLTNTIPLLFGCFIKLPKSPFHHVTKPSVPTAPNENPD